jgi:hypothetical protein
MLQIRRLPRANRDSASAPTPEAEKMRLQRRSRYEVLGQ